METTPDLTELIGAIAALHAVTSQPNMNTNAVEQAIENLKAADAKVPALGHIFKPSPPVGAGMRMVTADAMHTYFAGVVRMLHSKSIETPIKLRVVKQLSSDVLYIWERCPR